MAGISCFDRRHDASIHSCLHWIEVNSDFLLGSYDSSQFRAMCISNLKEPASFLKLDSSLHPSIAATGMPLCQLTFIVHVRHNFHSMFYAMCVGEASNPGPCDGNIRLAVCNPTAIHRKIGALMKFQADVICASETSATNVIQTFRRMSRGT